MENSYYVKNWENRISGSKSNFSELLAKSVHLDLSYMWKEMFWTIKENSYCAEKWRNGSCLSSNSTLIFCLNLFTRNPFLIKILLFLKWAYLCPKSTLDIFCECAYYLFWNFTWWQELKSGLKWLFFNFGVNLDHFSFQKQYFWTFFWTCALIFLIF